MGPIILLPPKRIDTTLPFAVVVRVGKLVGLLVCVPVGGLVGFVGADDVRLVGDAVGLNVGPFGVGFGVGNLVGVLLGVRVGRGVGLGVMSPSQSMPYHSHSVWLERNGSVLPCLLQYLSPL